MGDFKDWESGRETTSAHGGQKVITDYPVDRSSGDGAMAGKFPGRGRELAGSLDDLSHSIKGASAHQGYDSNGTTDTVKYPSKP